MSKNRISLEKAVEIFKKNLKDKLELIIRVKRVRPRNAILTSIKLISLYIFSFVFMSLGIMYVMVILVFLYGS